MAEWVNHPNHYNQGKRETIEEMRLMFGDQAVAIFCRLSAYKYMRRADYKGKKEEDLAKAEWYMDYVEKLEGEREEKYCMCNDSQPIHVILEPSNICNNTASVSSSFGIPVENGGYTPV